jgi:hypothetical protein
MINSNKKKKVASIMERLDWWITEKVDQARTFDGNPLTEEEWNTTYEMKDILLPISRWYDEEVKLTFDKPEVTLREFLQAVYDFYQKPIAEEHMPTAEMKEGDDFFEDGYEPKIYLDLVTHYRDQGRGSGDTDGEKRHPYSCSGKVRFEGRGWLPSEKMYCLALGT